jgi:putative acyl-CoA dehydrogenase
VPVNAIWEGSGNVVCADVLRVMARERAGAEAVLKSLRQEAAALPGAEETAAMIAKRLAEPEVEASARGVVELLAQLAAAAALRASAPEIAEIFAATRLSQGRTATYGAAAISPAAQAMLLERALS